MKHCKKCGATIPSNLKFCTNCGAKQGGIPTFVKVLIIIGVVLGLLFGCVAACTVGLGKAVDDAVKESNDNKSKIECSSGNQYSDGYSYYIEGSCVNNSSKDYSYLQVEYICYDKEGNNLGTALDNTNKLLKGETWKFKAFSMTSDDKKIDHCDYHEVTGW